jgi:16S rRNA processing protein RimM
MTVMDGPMPDTPSRSKRVHVARIGAPHGVRGEVKLWSFTEDPAAVVDYAPFETQDGKRHFEIEAMRPAKDFFVVRFKGIADRDAAARLTNLDLYVPRERLPEPEDDGEFYISDLIGLAAVDTAGAPLGRIIAVYNFGAGDIIELQREGQSKTDMVPFSDAVVPEIDLDAGRVVIAPPDGLFEE